MKVMILNTKSRDSSEPVSLNTMNATVYISAAPNITPNIRFINIVSMIFLNFCI